jgi:spermidine/putrescine transport system permease protein
VATVGTPAAGRPLAQAGLRTRLRLWVEGKPLALVAMGVYVFLFAPLLVLILYSFNDSKRIVWQGFTTRWYRDLLRDPTITSAFADSFRIGLIATLVSTVLGTMIAFALVRHRVRARTATEISLLGPMITPEIIMAAGLLVLFAQFSRLPGFLGRYLGPGFWAVVASHIMFCIPFVVVTVRARLRVMDQALEEAAADLGADPITTFTKVTFPIALPGIFAGAMLAFTLSFDDFVITTFTSGPGVTTVPLKVFSMLKFGISPVINAISAILIVGTTCISLLALRFGGGTRNVARSLAE